MTDDHADVIRILWPDENDVPSRVVRCRHCETKNRVDVPTAVFDPDSCSCGSCGKGLFLDRDEPLTAISSRAYEHALDRNSMAALKAVPGFPAALRWLLANFSERMLRLQCMSGNLLVGPEQFPELLEILDRPRLRLDIPYRPTLFLGESPVMNAWTVGLEEPLIVVHSALLDQMGDVEVEAVLAHELGHVHADHVLYQTMARMLVLLGAMNSTVVNLLSWPIQLALYKWSRCAELTADRAGLLGCRDLSACLNLQLKFAGGFRPGIQTRTDLKLAPFIAQARELEQMETVSWLDNALVALLTMNRTHPFAAWRVMHLMQWVEKGNYLDIMAGDYARVKRQS